jgi:plastocyanin
MTRSAALRTAFSAVLAAVLTGSAGGAGPTTPVEITVRTPEGAPVADAVVVLRPATPVEAGASTRPLTMSQHDLQFDPHVLVATVGSNVAFPNADQVRHHVYSFSDAKTFELRLYGGETEHVVLFDRPGVVSLGCNIHDDMIAFIYVSDTPYAAKTDAEGRVRLDGAPPGDYALTVWHESLRGQDEIERPFTLGPDGAAETVEVELRRPRRRDRGY